MNVHDIELLAKKILVGIAITAVPAIILLGGLWVTQHALGVNHPSPSAVHQKGRP